MSIHFTCACGRKLKAKDESAGRNIRCPVCAKVTEVPTPIDLANAEDDAVSAGPPPIKPKSKSKSKPMPEDDDDAGYAVGEAPPVPVAERRRKQRDSRREERASRPRQSAEPSWGIVIHSQIITGILMMVGAVVWFVAGLAADRIYFYPPIMFVLGIAAVFKGILGRE